MIPFIDQDKLLSAVQKIDSSQLSKEETKRNSFGYSQLFYYSPTSSSNNSNNNNTNKDNSENLMASNELFKASIKNIENRCKYRNINISRLYKPTATATATTKEKEKEKEKEKDTEKGKGKEKKETVKEEQQTEEEEEKTPEEEEKQKENITNTIAEEIDKNIVFKPVPPKGYNPLSLPPKGMIINQHSPNHPSIYLFIIYLFLHSQSCRNSYYPNVTFLLLSKEDSS